MDGLTSYLYDRTAQYLTDALTDWALVRYLPLFAKYVDALAHDSGDLPFLVCVTLKLLYGARGWHEQPPVTVFHLSFNRVWQFNTRTSGTVCSASHRGRR